MGNTASPAAAEQAETPPLADKEAEENQEGPPMADNQPLRKSLREEIAVGLLFQQRELYPIFEHRKSCLFDEEKLSTFREMSDPMDEISEISGSSFDKFAEDFRAKLAASIENPVAIVPAARAEVGIQSHKVSETSAAFFQRRHHILRRRIALPVPEAGGSNHAIRDLLLDHVRDKIDGIASVEEADMFLRESGYHYINLAHLGASRVFAWKFTENEDLSLSNMHAKIGLEATGAAEGVAEVLRKKEEIKKIVEKDLMEQTIGESHGDDEENINKNAWITKIERHPKIVKCDFKPIYELARDEEGENGKKSKTYLKSAYEAALKKQEREVHPIHSDTKYHVQNCKMKDEKDPKSWLDLSLDHTEEGPFLPKVSPQPQHIEVGFLCSEDTLQEQNYVDVTLSSSGDHFLKRTKRIFPRDTHCLGLSKNSYADKKRNQWRLELVKGGGEHKEFWHIKSIKDNSYLGVGKGDHDGDLILHHWKLKQVPDKRFKWIFKETDENSAL